MYVRKAKSQNHLSACFSYHRIHHLLATIEPLQSTGWPGSDYFWVGLVNHRSVGHFFTWPTMIILVIFSHPQDKLQQQQWRTHSKNKKMFLLFPPQPKVLQVFAICHMMGIFSAIANPLLYGYFNQVLYAMILWPGFTNAYKLSWWPFFLTRSSHVVLLRL